MQEAWYLVYELRGSSSRECIEGATSHQTWRKQFLFFKTFVIQISSNRSIRQNVSWSENASPP